MPPEQLELALNESPRRGVNHPGHGTEGTSSMRANRSLPLESYYTVDPETGCWVWTERRRGTGGYGKHTRGIAHRVVWEAMVGPIPEGLVLDHLCKNRPCVNPEHLEPVTPAENNARSDSITARYAKATHCIRGHEFTEENTYRTDKARGCRTCRSAARRAHEARQRIGEDEYPLVWRVKLIRPEWFGRRCRIVIHPRNGTGNRLIEFEDGYRTVCPGAYLRRAENHVEARKAA